MEKVFGENEFIDGLRRGRGFPVWKGKPCLQPMGGSVLFG
jgi:hypothetical protein